jgi:hypothetical protein
MKGMLFLKIEEELLEIKESLSDTSINENFILALFLTFHKFKMIINTPSGATKTAMLRSENPILKGKKGYFNFGLE